ncbi:MAG: hypothetical protein ABL903_11160 [Methylococcales bacterium]
MNRRRFLGFIVLAGAAVSVPLLYRKYFSFLSGNPIFHPSVLSHICSEQMLRQIGISYRALFPKENSESQLLALLVHAKAFNTAQSANSPLSAEQLKLEVQKDFSDKKTIIVNGWVLSVTEARQCALLSFH